MSVRAVSFFRPSPQSRDWSNQELAEFYRVEASLIRGGLLIDTDRGLSDEGDPWFVFCHRETSEVIVHFARIDGYYVVASSAIEGCARGRQFRPLIENVIEKYPITIPRSPSGGKLFIHPAALLVAFVTVCFYKLGQTDAVAAELKHAMPAAGATLTPVQKEVPGGVQSIALDEQTTTALLAAIASAVWAAGSGDTQTNVAPIISTPDLGALAAGNLPSIDSLFSSDIVSTIHLRSQAISDLTTGDDASSLLFALHSRPLDTHSIALPQTVAALDDLTIALPTSTPSTVHSAGPGAGPGPTLQFAVQGAASNLIVASTTSVATQEVQLALGASAQTHLVKDLSGAEAQLILAVAPAQAPTIVSSTALEASVAHATTSSNATQSGANALPTSAATALTVELNAAENTIEQFVAVHQDFQLIKSSAETIIYDSHLTPTNMSSAIQETFSFPDGSSIFLIGLPAVPHSTPFLS